jgi:hypothetical protein
MAVLASPHCRFRQIELPNLTRPIGVISAAMDHIAFPLILGACLALAGIALLAVALF